MQRAHRIPYVLGSIVDLTQTDDEQPSQSTPPRHQLDLFNLGTNLTGLSEYVDDVRQRSLELHPGSELNVRQHQGFEEDLVGDLPTNRSLSTDLCEGKQDDQESIPLDTPPHDIITRDRTMGKRTHRAMSVSDATGGTWSTNKYVGIEYLQEAGFNKQHINRLKRIAGNCETLTIDMNK